MPRALTEFEKRERMYQKIEANKSFSLQNDTAVVKQDLSTDTGEPKPTRKRRNVFNGTEAKISVKEQIEGYHLHVFTDTGSRIDEALSSGYEFVKPAEVGGVSENVVSRNGDLGERIRYLVNPRAEGSEQYGYLMKIRQEWYEEDQAELQTKNNLIDAAIRKGKITGENPSFYIPRDGIKLN